MSDEVQRPIGELVTRMTLVTVFFISSSVDHNQFEFLQCRTQHRRLWQPHLFGSGVSVTQAVREHCFLALPFVGPIA